MVVAKRPSCKNYVDDQDIIISVNNSDILNSKCVSCIFSVNMVFYGYDEDVCVPIKDGGSVIEICLGGGTDTNRKCYLPMSPVIEVDISLYKDYVNIFYVVEHGRIISKK